MSNISRREFLRRALAAGVASTIALTGFSRRGEAAARQAQSNPAQVGTLIDLTLCDGCREEKIPRCVKACRTVNRERFPNPSHPIPDNWPQKKKEDWSHQKDSINRLTPYNWTFVQHVKVLYNGQVYELYIPRRCMHCDNPPCANLCPFAAQYKTPAGPVLINKDLCLGGAKCRDVCPWGIPARQAGVGLYMKIAPGYLGGGVMYKCDLCYDRIKTGNQPACISACPRGALRFGLKGEMKEAALARAAALNGFTYGIRENGGTSTFYVSPVPFQLIDEALKQQKVTQPNPSLPGFPTMPVEVENFTDTVNGLAIGLVIAPIAGTIAAGYAAYKSLKGEENDDR